MMSPSTCTPSPGENRSVPIRKRSFTVCPLRLRPQIYLRVDVAGIFPTPRLPSRQRVARYPVDFSGVAIQKQMSPPHHSALDR